jgi:hypothetical protein
MTPLATSSPKRQEKADKPKHPNGLKVVVANCQGLRAKKEAVEIMLNTVNPDIFIGTETHLNNTIANSEILPSKYATQVHRRDRPNKGGGVLIAARNDIMMTDLPELSPEESETAWAEVQILGKRLLVGAHYRPPKSKDTILKDLDQSISKVISKHKNAEIILGGDFNLGSIDWETLSTTTGGTDIAQCNYLLDLAQKHNLTQMVTEPTRGENTLDLCFTTTPGLTKRCTTGPGVSDHDHLVILETQLRAKPNKKKPRTVSLYKKANWDKVRQDITTLETEFYNRRPLEKSVEENWSFLKEGVIEAMKNNIPTKRVSGKYNLPWFTREAKHLHQKKKRAYQRAKKTKKNKDWIHFRHLRKAFQQILRRAHWDYLNSILDPEEDRTSKNLWSYIKSKRQDNSGVSALKSDGKLITDPQEKATVLNNQFVSVFTREDTSKFPEKGPSPYPTMPPILITREGVRKLLSKLQVKKATGPDQIPARVLKEAADPLSGINRSTRERSQRIGDRQMSHLFSRRVTRELQPTTDPCR